MSGSVTVVGSSINNGLIGIVTVNGAFGAVVTPIQTLLSTLSNDVVSIGANFENIDAAGRTGNLNTTVGASNTGIFELTDTDSVSGTTTAGSTNVSLSVPTNYGAIVVQAAGSATISSAATNVLALFDQQSAVDFNGFGTGTVVAGGAGDFVGLDGGTWSVDAGGGTTGDSIQSAANNATINTAGAANVVGLLGGNSSISLGGSGDLVETYNSGVTGAITVAGANDRILVNGGSDTVTAVTGSSGLNAFFNLSGGALDFINNSTTAATISGAVNGAIGGSVTAFGGAGGGVYVGGPGGNNSLIGGTGLVSLFGAGTNNLEIANGAGAAGNQLAVDTGGTSTLIASASTTTNTFYGNQNGGGGTSVMQSSGSGLQTFFVGSNDTENLTGSTVTGATNNYYFLQGSTGSGNDVITDFSLSRDKIFIDTIADTGQAKVNSVEAYGGAAGGSQIFLTNNTVITLYGVSTAQLTAAGVTKGTTTI